jgi:hypothetical protein
MGNHYTLGFVVRSIALFALVGVFGGCASVETRDLSGLEAEPVVSCKLLEGQYWDEKEYGLPHSAGTSRVSLWEFLTYQHEAEWEDGVCDNFVTISHCTPAGFDATLSGHSSGFAHVTGCFKDGYFFLDHGVKHEQPFPVPIIHTHYNVCVGIGRTKANGGLTVCSDQDGLMFLLVVPAAGGAGYRMNACFDRKPIATAE